MSISTKYFRYEIKEKITENGIAVILRPYHSSYGEIPDHRTYVACARIWDRMAENYPHKGDIIFKGVARLKDKNDYDVNLARRIARKKAKRQYYSALSRAAKEIFEESQDFAEAKRYFDVKKNHITESIKEMTTKN